MLELAHGRRRKYDNGKSVINAPRKGLGFRVWPSPRATAWAVKQYNHLGGYWKPRKEERETKEASDFGGLLVEPGVREMNYSYDRTKTARAIDLHSKWRDIVDKHEKAEHREFDELLKELERYLKPMSIELDLSKSYLGKRHHGSDGWRLEGQLELLGNSSMTTKDKVKKWIEEATGISGTVTPGSGPGDLTELRVWVVDIGEY